MNYQRVKSGIIARGDVAIIDDCLALLPGLLLGIGLPLEQRQGYKAGKISGRRNWCQLVDGDVPLRIRFPNSRGQTKTWKLFARFKESAAPSSPWDRPQRYERKKAQWMLAGDDVWGIAYDDIRRWAEQKTSAELLQRLVGDFQISFDYSRRRYR